MSTTDSTKPSFDWGRAFFILAIGTILYIIVAALWGDYKAKPAVEQFKERIVDLARNYDIPAYPFDVVCFKHEVTASLKVTLTTAANAQVPVLVPLGDKCTKDFDMDEPLFTVRYSDAQLPIVKAKDYEDGDIAWSVMNSPEKFAFSFNSGLQSSLSKAQLRYEQRRKGIMTSRSATPRNVPVTVSTAVSNKPVIVAKVKTASQKDTTRDTVNQNMSAN